jgi:ATP-dependent DNA helicase PIF1
MRVGIVSDATEKYIQSLSRSVRYKDGIEATCLYPLRKQVEDANNTRLASLAGESKIFKDVNTAPFEGDMKKLNDSLIAQDQLELKEGAQVMCIKNLSRDIVNGSLGKVVGFDDSLGNFIGSHRAVKPRSKLMMTQPQAFRLLNF